MLSFDVVEDSGRGAADADSVVVEDVVWEELETGRSGVSSGPISPAS